MHRSIFFILFTIFIILLSTGNIDFIVLILLLILSTVLINNNNSVIYQYGGTIKEEDKPIVYYKVYKSDLDPNFENLVDNILKNSKWNKKYNIIKVDESKSLTKKIIHIRLMNKEKMHLYSDTVRYYPSGKKIRYSVTQIGLGDPIIYIDELNWLNGVPESGLDIDKYRTYVINHEFGHGLGYDHKSCSRFTDEICPVMYQSTVGCPLGTSCGYQPSDAEM